MTDEEEMREIIRFAEHKFVIRLDGQQVVALVATIDLACRNPNFRGPTRLIAENILAQVVTGPVLGPRASWIEASFSLFYVVLFVASAVIVFHYQFIKSAHFPLGQPHQQAD